MSLPDQIRTEITTMGPMRLDHYIERCLWDLDAGYYATKPVFGSAGDFVTAPMISQVFGEILGAWLLQCQADQNTGDFVLLEMGAGSGHLMHDVLRVFEKYASSISSYRPVILEKSEMLRARQKTLIPNITHILDLTMLAKKPLFVFSNEFFDALPIRQFRLEKGVFFEHFIDAGFHSLWQYAPDPPKTITQNAQLDHLYEYRPNLEPIAQQLGAHIRAYGGAFITFDYGAWDGMGDTLQALYRHAYTSPLTHQGEADITAHVHFRTLAQALGLQNSFATQGAFLDACGGHIRAQNLAQQNPAQKQAILDAYQRLSAPTQMGTLFKVLGAHNFTTPLPGLDKMDAHENI